MGPVLKWIIMNNFKSYPDTIKVGPLMSFNAVIGPNGSGKSNFMDAISFAMGEKTRSLRCKKLSDLIHGDHIGQPVSNSASVTAIFTLDETEISFKRTILGSTSEYRFNDTVVSSQEYLAELEKLQVNVKAKNFLVFQGEVESFAMKSPKQVTAILEEVSGSKVFVQDYERLKEQLRTVEDDVAHLHEKKKIDVGHYREAKLAGQEAKQYIQLKKSLSEKQIQLQLFYLYHNEQEIKSLQDNLASKLRMMEKLAIQKEKAEDAAKASAKEYDKVSRDLAKLEQDLREMEVEMYKKKPHFIKLKEHVGYIQDKLASSRKTLEEAKKAHNQHRREISQLEDELAITEKAKSDYEAAIAEESQSQGEDIELVNEQVREYNRLKEEAGKRSATVLQELDSLQRVQRSDQDRLDHLSRFCEEAEIRLKSKRQEKSELETRVSKLNSHIRLGNQSLSEQRQLRENLLSGINSSKERLELLQSHLEKVTEQLGDAKIDSSEYKRASRKQNIVEEFRSRFPGVYDRLINMCKPTHKRYNIAITKVFGRDMEAIVVDTKETAMKCISYLKINQEERETFLPLDYIKCNALQESLRHIPDPAGVKLLYDLVNYEPREIKRVILYVTKNTLVCENAEDAAKVAYKLGHNAVTLEGSYYQKSGLISGGSADLAHKAKRWDQNDILQLKEEKKSITAELDTLRVYSRKESELANTEALIGGLEIRLRYATIDVDNTKNEIQRIAVEIPQLENQLVQNKSVIEEIVNGMRVCEDQIKQITAAVNNIEDEVFARFCQEIGVRNIRQFESRQLKAHGERNQKLLEFQNQINRIKNTLEFEKSRDTQANVTRWESTTAEECEKLRTAQNKEVEVRKAIETDNRHMDSLRAACLSKRREFDALEKKVKNDKREVVSNAKELSAAQKRIYVIEGNIEKKKSKRHDHLTKCQLDAISIPLLVGNMEDLLCFEPTQVSSTENSSTVQQYEREARIQIDYSSLSRQLKHSQDAETQAQELLDEIEELQRTVAKIDANLKDKKSLDSASNMLHKTSDELKRLTQQAHTLKPEFEQIKQQRHNLFTECLNHLKNEIDNIYKLLNQTQLAQAFLDEVNNEEPYLDGINYSCITPGKRYQTMLNLSGGERTLAALTLLFAIHSYKSSPFFVLDEIDAALDNSNIEKVAKYFQSKKSSLQTIVLSLKLMFYSHADYVILVTNISKGKQTKMGMVAVDVSEEPEN